jgi:hypothetical protein
VVKSPLIPVPYKKKKGGRSPQSHRVNLCCLLISFEIQSAHSDIPQTNPIPMAIGVVIAQNITNSHVCTLRNSVAVASSSCCVYRLVFIIIEGPFRAQPLVSLRNTYLESTIYLANTTRRLITKIKTLSPSDLSIMLRNSRGL